MKTMQAHGLCVALIKNSKLQYVRISNRNNTTKYNSLSAGHSGQKTRGHPQNVCGLQPQSMQCTRKSSLRPFHQKLQFPRSRKQIFLGINKDASGKDHLPLGTTKNIIRMAISNVSFS